MTCREQGCERNIHAKQMCSMHYQQARRSQNPRPTHPQGVDDITIRRFKKTAGNGTVDERCARLLAARSETWFGTPNDRDERRRA